MIKEFTVKRATWRNGSNIQDDTAASGLWVESSGRFLGQCCLGHVMNQLGFTREQMKGEAYPNNVAEGVLFTQKPSPERGQEYVQERGLAPFVNVKPNPWGTGTAVFENTELAARAAEINDDGFLTKVQREEKLIALFSEYGLVLRFED